jgi:type I restriction enzyme R subunit
LEDILFNGKTLGTIQDYLDNYGDKPLGEFIQSIVGLDVAAAQAAFADFIQTGNLRVDQMTIINNIISDLTTMG